jgi:hypothetical protein
MLPSASSALATAAWRARTVARQLRAIEKIETTTKSPQPT